MNRQKAVVSKQLCRDGTLWDAVDRPGAATKGKLLDWAGEAQASLVVGD